VRETAVQDSVGLAELAALNANFSATRAAYDSTFAHAHAQRAAMLAKLISLRVKMAALTTDAEWDQLKKDRLKMLQQEEQALSL